MLLVSILYECTVHAARCHRTGVFSSASPMLLGKGAARRHHASLAKAVWVHEALGLH